MWPNPRGVGFTFTARNRNIIFISGIGASEKFHNLSQPFLRPRHSHACQLSSILWSSLFKAPATFQMGASQSLLQPKGSDFAKIFSIRQIIICYSNVWYIFLHTEGIFDVTWKNLRTTDGHKICTGALHVMYWYSYMFILLVILLCLGSQMEIF